MKKKSVIFITVIIMSIVVLSIGQVVVSNSLSTTGITLAKIEKEIDSYSLENALLREKLLADESLHHIASYAATVGFVETRSQLVIGRSMPIAIKP